MTLTEAARLTRKIAFWGGLLVVFLIFLRVSVGIGIGIFRQIFPKPTPPPTVTFGKLTPYDFSQNIATTSAEAIFVIKTIREDLPNLGDRAKVYKVVQNPPSILFGEHARRQAQNLGFNPEPETTTERIYTFSDPQLPGRKLELDVILGNFRIKNDLNLYPEILGMAGKLNRDEAVNIARNFLSRNSSFQEKVFPEEKITVQPLKIEGGQLVAAKSFAESQIVRVGFGRADLEKIPILPVDAEIPNVWVEITPLGGAQQIFQASFFYYPEDPENPATYPIKSTQTAFEELAKGGGVLIGEKLQELEIRRIYLAYLETAAPMNFYLPVYVFAGDNFQGFVPAIPSEWFGQ